MTDVAVLTKYEEVANHVVHLIDHGTFRPGQRVPSVRSLSDQLSVSVTTVLEAYKLLESRGRIESRPQSGYYVRNRPCEVPSVNCSTPSSRPAAVGVDALVLRVMQDTRNPDLVQLGAAVPNPALLPTEKLNRHLARVARQLASKSHLYDVPPGCEPLRIQVAQRVLGAGAVLTPDDIMTTNGCLEAISLALRAITRPGDTVAIESPTYFGVLQAIELLGLKVLEIPTHPVTGVSIDALRFALEQHTLAACVFMANFNNPLGCCIPDNDKKELVALLAEHDVPLIEDDVYGDLYFGTERPKVAKAFDKKGLVLLCSSYSKDLAPGYRVGWIAPGRYKKQIMRLKSATNVANATLPQYAIADFLETGGYDAHMRRIRRAYSQQMAWMVEAVGRHFPSGTRISQPQGGFVLWLELPVQVDSIALYEDALRAGITFAPGPIFSARQKYRNFIRLNYAYWSDAVEAAVVRLGTLAASHANRPHK